MKKAIQAIKDVETSTKVWFIVSITCNIILWVMIANGYTA